MMIKIAESGDEKEQLDELLWKVLWNSLAYPFFVKQGFIPATDQWTDHPYFNKHAIRFILVERYV